MERIKQAHPEAKRVVWITLREEPIVYINGAPYCLRRESFSLRNMKGETKGVEKRDCDANCIGQIMEGSPRRGLRFLRSG